MADTDKSLYSLRYNQINSTLEAFGGGSPQWTQVTLNNVDPTQVPVTRQINTTAPLQGGGNLTADRTISIPQATSSVDGFLLAADWTTFNSKLTSILNSANIFVGNGSNVAVGVALSGDAALSNTGTLTFNTVNGNVGTFTNAQITVNAKGLITAASSGAIGNLTDTGTDGIVVTGGIGAVLGTGTSLAQHVADTTHNGYLSSTDWNTFNGKQAAGNYITALTGDITATGPGSVAATLATVNGNVGSFTNANITVNAKGLITAASNGTDSGITQLTGDATAGPGSGSQAITFATVNGNVGSFTNASITVNAKGLITAASSGTSQVTSVSGTTNQITSTGGTTPVLALANPLTFPGAMTAGGALAMAANKITGLANGTAAQDAVAFSQISGFRILQIQQGTISGTFTTTSSTFTAVTSLSVAITPASTSSTILVIAVGQYGADTAANPAYATIKRGSTNLGSANGLTCSDVSVGNAWVPCTMIIWDSPATTSATTYQVFVRNNDNVHTVTWGEDSPKSFIYAIEIG